jgi:thiamine monophosphate synthase
MISAVGIGGVTTVNMVKVVTQDMRSCAVTTAIRRETAMENQAETILEVIMTAIL